MFGRRKPKQEVAAFTHAPECSYFADAMKLARVIKTEQELGTIPLLANDAQNMINLYVFWSRHYLWKNGNVTKL